MLKDCCFACGPRYGDFATAEYSRLARARVLYQLGRTSDAILQLEVGPGWCRPALLLPAAAPPCHALCGVPPAACPPCRRPSSACPPHLLPLPAAPLNTTTHPTPAQDLEVSLRGYAEVHAALAAVLYVERPALLQVAEQQWEIAMVRRGGARRRTCSGPSVCLPG